MKPFLFAAFVSMAFACGSYAQSVSSSQSKPSGIFDLSTVPEIELDLSLAQWNKLLSNFDLNPKNEKKVVAAMRWTSAGQTIVLDSIGLKLRGNTSRRRPEGTTGQLHKAASADWHHCHFALDFAQFRHTQRFLNLSKLNLKWCKDDPTYVREIYSYDLFRRYGVWTAPRASYCRLKVNVAGDPQPAYYGIYEMIESVGDDFIAARSEHWAPDAGFLWKGGYAGKDVPDFVSAAGIGIEDVKLDPAKSQYFAYDLKTRKKEFSGAKSQLVEFIQNLNSKTGDDFKTWIAQKMDVPLFLKTYATSVMLGMWDDYWANTNNFYFYFAPGGKAYFIPYDYDNTLGTSQIVANSGTQNPLEWGPAAGRPLVNKILAVREYRDMYEADIRELANPGKDLFDPAKSKQRILGWQTLISPYISNDTGEDMAISDRPASWGNAPFYRLLSGNAEGGSKGNANFFASKIKSIPSP
jgi:spore coat protein CotH